MEERQKDVWQNNQRMLVNNLNIGQLAVSIERYEVRIALNDDQDLVVFPASLPDRNMGDEGQDLPVGMVVETFEVKRKGDEPETTKLIGLFTDWQACLFVAEGYLKAHEVIL